MSDESSRREADSPLHTSVRSEPIKINDRRKFHKSGQLREDLPPEEEAPAAPAAGRETKAGGKPAGGAAAPAEGGRTAGNQPSGAPAGETGRPQAPGAVDFQSFVYFLYMSALHELGVPAEAGAPARPADLERARFFVEVLQVIEEKTKGNLSPGESRLLEEALYNLRMQYVGISQTRPA